MWKNYLKIAWRHLWRQKEFSLLNLVGLSIGLGCVLLISMSILDELSYDAFHSKAERLYRFVQQSEGGARQGSTAPAWADAFKTDAPQIEQTVRFYTSYNGSLVSVSSPAGEKSQYEPKFLFADANVFEVFDFPLIAGDAESALTEPNTVVLTESAAARYFGSENSLGKIIRYDNKLDLKVTGVAKDVPANSHIRFEWLGSMATIKAMEGDAFKSFFYNPFETFVLLRNGVSERDMPPVLNAIKQKYVGADVPLKPALQRFTDIHFIYEDAKSSVYLLAAIAGIILLIAGINYTNLATARYAKRAREVGVRKTFGASRRELAGQFWGESLLLTALALGFALILAEAATPYFNSITGKHVSLFSAGAWRFMGVIVATLFVVSLLAGAYPAIFLSRFNPTTVLRGSSISGTGRLSFRAPLMVVQFALSMVMIIATLIVQAQLDFVQQKKLGFDREQVLLLNLKGEESFKNTALLKDAFKAVPGVSQVSLSSVAPGKGDVTIQMPIAFKYLASGDKNPNVKWLCIDEAYLPLYNIDLAEGRNLIANSASDSGAFLINESMAKKLQWADPIGREIGYDIGEKASGYHIQKTGRVIGVVKDFHIGSLRKEIDPLLIHLYPQFMSVVSVRLAAGNVRETISRLEAAWKTYAPNRPFEYSFLDDDYTSLYQQEMRLRAIVSVFAGLAIFVACLGLFGLAAFTAEQRTKEIGIRKVLGASITDIITLLSTGFLKLVGIAFLIAAPIGYLVMTRWLNHFAYRIEPSVSTFLIAGVAAALIALITVSGQAIKAAQQNPVKSLRYE
jgi:putative ABC transport system permease protein